MFRVRNICGSRDGCQGGCKKVPEEGGLLDEGALMKVPTTFAATTPFGLPSCVHTRELHSHEAA